MELAMCPVSPPAQSRKAQRMREVESDRWREGQNKVWWQLGLKNQIGPVRCEQITNIQDGDSRALLIRPEHLKDLIFSTHPD